MRFRKQALLLLFSLFILSSSLIAPAFPLINMAGIPDSAGSSSEVPSSLLGISTPLPPAGPTLVDGEYQYDGLGTVLNTTEYAVGTNQSLEVPESNPMDYGDDRYGEIRLPAGWTGYELIGNVDNLHDKLYWINGTRENGDFEASSGSDPTEWNYTSYWVASPNSHSGSYGTSYGRSSTNGVRVQAAWSNNYDMNDDSYAAWFNNISIPRTDVSYAKLTFYVQVNQISVGQPDCRGNLVIYVEVEGIVYPRLLASTAPNDGQWYQVNVSIPYDDILTWSLPLLTVRLGLSFTADVDAPAAEEWALDFDDVTLEITGKAQPDHAWVDLRLNSTAVTSTGYGTGTITLTGTWANPGASHSTVQALWETYSSNSSGVYFDYNLTLYITKDSTTEQQTGPEGTTFSAQNETSVYWNTWYYAYQPFYFDDYNLTIALPTTETWTIDTVIDALFNNRTSPVTTDSNSTHIRMTHSTINDAYGWWNFTLTSPNRVDTVTLNFDTFQIAPNTPNSLSVSATFGKTTGEANLTLYDPSGTIVAEDTQSVVAGAASFSAVSFDNGTEFAAGEYTLCVSYDNGDTQSMTAAGFNSTIITVTHGTTTLIPQYSTIEVIRQTGSYFYPRVRFYSNDTSPTDTFLEGATVVGNWTGSDTFELVGGFYVVELDSTAQNAGNYTLRVNATKQYHADAYCLITVSVVEETTLTSPSTPGFSIPYGETTNVNFAYRREVDETGIESATVTSNWTNAVNPTAQGSGWYNFTIDSGEVSEPGTYYMTVTAQRTSYQTQTLTLTILVQARNTQLSTGAILTVPFGNDSVFDITLTDLDNSSNPVSNSTGHIHLQVWNSTHRWDTLGYATITYSGSIGVYEISLNTSYLEGLGTHTFEIRFYWYLNGSANDPFFANRTVTAYVSVRARNTQLSSTTPSTLPLNEQANLTVTITDLDEGGANLPSSPNVNLTLWYSGALWTDATITEFAAGIWNITIDTSTLPGAGQYTFTVNFTWYDAAGANNPFYANRTVDVILTLRQINTVVFYDAPNPEPWGTDMSVTINYFVDDSASSEHGTFPAVTTITCELNGTPLVLNINFTWTSLGGGEYLITINASVLTEVALYELDITVTPTSTDYTSASRSLTFDIRAHLTQTIVDQPDPVGIGNNVTVTVTWTDLDTNTDLTASVLDRVDVRFQNGTAISNHTSLTFILDTDDWTTNTYNLTAYVYSNTSLYVYSQGNLRITIRTHQTAVFVEPPDETPWGWQTQLVVQWTDLEDGSLLTDSDLLNVTVLFANGSLVTTANSLTFWLDTSTWNLATETLTVQVYALTSPRLYEDDNATVQVTIRAHRVSVSIQTPNPTAWGLNASLTVTWTDLDNGTTLTDTELDNVTISNCPVGGDQSSSTIGPFTLKTDTWSVGDHLVNATVYSNTNNYQIGSYQVTVTIRAHYASVTADPPAQSPWGTNTSVTINWQDSDTSTAIDLTALDNITVTGCPVGGDQTFTGSFTFILDTEAWSVGSFSLTIYVYGNSSYYATNGPVIITIREHQTQTVVSPPEQTPFDFNTSISVDWVDLDLGSSDVPSGNLSSIVVSNCPVGGDQTFYSLSFTLDTDSWTVGTYVLTVSVYANGAFGYYLNSSSSLTVIIRIHYTAVTVQPPNSTPYGLNTTLTVIWTDLDTGQILSTSQLDNITVSDCPVGGDQTFTGTFSPTLDTDSWSISTGYSLTVTVYTASGNYADASGSVTVVVRLHRVEVIVNTPAPIAWGLNTSLTVTWNDLDLGTTIDVSNLDNITVSNTPVGGNQTFTGSFIFTLVCDDWNVGAHLITVTAYPDMAPQLYDIDSYNLTITIRAHYVTVTVDPPAQNPWGTNTSLTVNWRDIDTDSDISVSALINITVTNCPVGGDQVFTGSLTFTLDTEDWGVNSYSLTVYVYGNTSYDTGDGTVTITIRAHQTQTITSPPEQTPFDFNTSITVQWVDIDLGSSDVPSGNLSAVVVSNCPVGGDQTFSSLSFTLDTDSWSVGSYTLTITINASAALGFYQNSSSSVTVIIRIHYTTVVVQSPEPTPWSENTSLTIIWTDLDTGAILDTSNLSNITVSGCPVGGNQTFTGTFAPTLDTDSWSISAGYSLSVTIYATTGPRNYSDATGSVTVVIRIHQAEAIASTPAPTAFDLNTSITVTWNDLDTGTSINVSNLDNITVSNCPVGGNQTFTGSLSFTLKTDDWSVGSYQITITVYPDMSPQQYETDIYTVTITIRAHYVSVTINPPAQTAWGENTTLVVNWEDVDTSTTISVSALDNITVTGCPVGGDQTFTGSLTIILDTEGWGVDGHTLTVYVYGNTSYDTGSGSVTVTIRSHQTQTIVSPPEQTPFDFNTSITVQWVDLDLGSVDVASGNLSSVVISNCPVGGDQTFTSLSFTLDTDSWTTGSYTLTVTVYANVSLGFYQNSSASVTVTIRLHYTAVVAQSPEHTPWGENTSLILVWTDLDTGAILDTSNLQNITITNCPVGGDQVFTGTFTFTLDTDSWSISAGYTLTVNLYATTGPRNYNDPTTSVTVVVRTHRTEIIVTTPAPTGWGLNTSSTLVWNDLDTGSTIAVVNLDNITVSNCPVGGDQVFTGSYTFTLVTDNWGVGSHQVSVTLYPDMAPQLYDIDSYTVTITIRNHYTSVVVDPPQQSAWGTNTSLTVTYTDTDTSTTISVDALINITVTGCPVGGDQVFTGTFSFILDTEDWGVADHVLTVYVYGNDSYADGSGLVTVTIRSHQTQAIVSPPEQTPFDFNTSISVRWVDLDLGSSDVPSGNLSSIVVSNCPVGGDQTFASLSFILDTDSWTTGSYTLTVTIYANVSLGFYQNSSSSVTVTIRLHYTAVVAQSPEQTPWGFNTSLTLVWTDLDTGAILDTSNLANITITNCPVGGDQVFTGTFTFTLDTDSWSISAGYSLTVNLYAMTGPRNYNDPTTTVTVVIRVHRTEIIVTTPEPTGWGLNTSVTLVWNDLDTGSIIAVVNLDNITVSNCPVGGDQTFTGSFTFTLVTDYWGVGAHPVNITLYPDMAPQQYDIDSYTVTVTIRNHYTSVVVNPPQQSAWGTNTSLTVTYTDTDTSTTISVDALINITVTGCPVGGDQVFTGSYSFTLDTEDWSVVDHVLTVYVYGNDSYADGSGSVTVTIRAHQTQTIVSPPEQTPFDFNTSITVQWVDLDLGSIDVASGNLSSIVVSNCPVGGDQTFGGLSFILDTDSWTTSSYTLTVTVYANASLGFYQNSSSSVTITIRIHYTSVVVQSPEQTPWGENTSLTLVWTDLDTGAILDTSNLENITISNCPLGGDQVFTGAFTFVLDTDSWSISTGYSLTVDLFATTGPQNYSDASSTVTVIIRIHNTEIIVTTPEPTGWGLNTSIILVWNDLDTGSTVTIANMDNITVSNCPVGGDQTFMGSFTFTLVTDDWGVGSHQVNVTLYPDMSPQLYDWDSYTVTVTIRNHYSSVVVDPPQQSAWGTNTSLSVTYTDTDTSTTISVDALINITVTGCPVGGDQVFTGSFTFTVDTEDWGVAGHVLTVYVYSNVSYADGSGLVTVTIRSHQTQTIVSPPEQTPFDFNTSLTVQWVDLDLGSADVASGNLSSVVVSNCPLGGDQTFASLSFTLDTDSWITGSYTLTVTIYANTSLGFYQNSSASVTVTIRLHYTAVVAQSPEQTPWGENTSLTLVWTDLDTGSILDTSNLENITITNCPIGGDQVFTGAFTFVLDTDGWSISAGYTLTVNLYATTGPRNYSDPITTVTVVIRVHRTEIIVTTPEPTGWGLNTSITLTWNDLDTISTIAVVNLDNITVSDCPVGGDQTFTGSFTFTLVTDDWGVGSHQVTVTLYPDMSPQQYNGDSYTLTVTIRNHYSSVVVDPPQQSAWGTNTSLTVTYTDTDTSTTISVDALDNITVTGCPVGGDQVFTGSYSFTLDTKDWGVAGYVLTVYVYSNVSYADGSGLVTVTIRSHQTQGIISPPEQTPFDFNASITVQWVDLDLGSSDVASGNLSSVVVSSCPVGGDQAFASLSFTLDTDSWTVGSYTLTVTIYANASLGFYQNGSASVTVTIRLHYAAVVVQSPEPTPWGFNTSLTIIWTDLDTGQILDTSNLANITVSGCPVGGDQTFTGTFTPVLDTDGWSISAGYTLTVTAYATTGPRNYSDASGSVTVVIEIHRVEVIVSTPAPTGWGLNTSVTLTWNDLDTGTTINVVNLDNVTVSDCPVGGNQSFTGSLSFILVTDDWGVGSHLVTVTIYPVMSPQLYEVDSYQVTITIRNHYVSATVNPPDQSPWGTNTSLEVNWVDTDTSTSIPVDALDNITVTGCPVGGDQVFTSSLSFELDTEDWGVGGYSLTVWVYGNTSYSDDSGTVTVTIRAHQTQTVVSPPQQTPFDFNTSMSVDWLDLDLGSSDVPGGNLSSVVVSGCPVGGDQSFSSLSFDLDTDSWVTGTYVLTVSVNASASLGFYLNSSSTVTVIIRIHFTAVVVQTPNPTPWGFNTSLSIQWIDLDTSTILDTSNLQNITVSGCPVGGDQTFTGSFTPTLDTDSWSISVGYSLTVTAYATTGPRYYDDSSGSLTVVIRIHRTEVIVATPSPTGRGQNTSITVTWNDLDTGTTIASVNVDNATVSNCPVGGNQTFAGVLSFTLDTEAWSVGDYQVVVTVFPDMSPQLYDIDSYTVTVTIRVHYTSVTLDPPAQTPWGSNTSLVVYWVDVDTGEAIPVSALDNITISGCPTGGNQTFTGSLSFALFTQNWSVGSFGLTVTVYGNSSYDTGSGSVTVTIRAHQTQTITSPPEQTPFDFNTSLSIQWTDLDSGSSDVPSGNLSLVVVSSCPTGGDQSFNSLSFTLITDNWTVGTYLLTVTIYANGTLGFYQNSSSTVTVVIRVHYTAIVVQTPDSTPWGFNTTLVITWMDLDTGAILGTSSLDNVTISGCPVGGDQSFSGTLSPVLDTDSWSISAGYTLTVDVYALTGPRNYTDASGSVTVVIRVHRVEVVAATPPATGRGQNTSITVTWNDLDTGTTIAALNVDNVTVSNCPVGGNQTFAGVLSFTLDTEAWSVGAYQVVVTVFPDMSPQLYDIDSYTVTITIRVHYVSVTLDPPSQTAWGVNTSLVVYWIDIDTGEAIPVSALVNITISDCPTGGNQVFTGSLSFSLETANWSVGSFDLTVTVYGNSSYDTGTGSVTVTIRAHQTQTVASPPEQTPFDFNTSMSVDWLDLDLGSSDVPSGNLSLVIVSNCPVGGDQSFASLSFTLDTDSWSVGSYSLTIMVVANASLGFYQNSSSTVTVVIRLHYTSVSIQTPEPTPWGQNTSIVLLWLDLDTGSILDASNLVNVTVSGCPVGGDQVFTGVFSFSLDTDGWSVNAGYSLSISVYATTGPRNYSDASGSVTVVIRGHRVNVVVTPPSPVPADGTVNITVSWEDADVGGVINASLYLNYINTTGSEASYPNLPAINYSVSFLLSAEGWTLTVHTLNVTVFPNDLTLFDIGWGLVTVTIRKHSIVGIIDPISSIPYQNNTWFTLRVNDSDTGEALNGSVVQLTISCSGYSSVIYNTTHWGTYVYNVSEGEYLVYLQSSSWSLGQHSVQITIETTLEYNDGVVNTKVTIRTLAISFLYTPPSSVPWGENGTLVVQYQVDDSVSANDTQVIANGVISISGWSLGTDFFVTDHGDGNYTITFTTTMLSSVGEHSFTISMASPHAYYEDGQIVGLVMTVRPLITTMIYNQVSSTPYGDDVNITLYYLVLDGESQFNGDFIPSATLNVTGLDGLVLVLDVNYTVADYGTYYLITINASLDIGSYKIQVDAIAPSSQYDNASISEITFHVRTVYTELERPPVDEVAFEENFVFQVIYKVLDDDSTQNLDGIPNVDHIYVTTNGSLGWTLTPSNYSVNHLGNGVYEITLNSSLTPYPGRWWVNISAEWDAATPNYEEQWVEAYLISEERPTTVVQTYPTDTGYADDIVVYLNYRDSISGWNNDNITRGGYVSIIVCNATTGAELLTEYVVENATTNPTYEFQIRINASQLGAIYEFLDFQVNVSWVGGNAPFYANATSVFSCRVTGTATVLYSDAPSAVSYQSDINITLHFETDGGNPIDNSSLLVGFEIGCADIPGFNSTFWSLDNSSHLSGVYVVTIHGYMDLDVGTYVFQINMTWPSSPPVPPYYSSATHQVSARITEVTTLLDWVQHEIVYYGMKLNITAWYYDLYTGVNQTDSGLWSLDPALSFTATLNLDGSWNITIDTSLLSAMEWSITLMANKSNYLSQERRIDLQIRPHILQIDRVDPSGLTSECYYLDQFNITVYLSSNHTGLPITSGQVNFTWASLPSDWLVELSGGFYYVLLNTSDVNAQTYVIAVQVTMGSNYTTPLLTYTLTIHPVSTVIDIPAGDTSTITTYLDTMIQLRVIYNVSGGSTITGATLTAYNGSLPIETLLLNATSGYYECWLNTSESEWAARPYQILIYAYATNYELQTTLFVITLDYKPCEITVESSTITSQYGDSVELTVFLGDSQTSLGIDGSTLAFTWGTHSGSLTSNGTLGYYTTVLVTSDIPKTYQLVITHETQQRYAYDEEIISLTVTPRETQYEIIGAYTLREIDGVLYNVSIDYTLSSWDAPIHDTLVVVVWFADYSNVTLTDVMGALGASQYSTAHEDFSFDSLTGYWRVEFPLTFYEDAEIQFTFDLDYHQQAEFSRSLSVTPIPVLLDWTAESLGLFPADNMFYVGQSYSFEFYLNDTYHICGVTNATIEISFSGSLSSTSVSVVEDTGRPGYYIVSVFGPAPSQGMVTFTAVKQDYSSSELQVGFFFEHNPLMNMMINGGIALAVILIIIVLFWLLWTRMLSVPPEVRRLRRLARKVGREGSFELSSKDRDRIRTRDAIMSKSVRQAFDQIDIPVQPAIVPVTTTIEEVSDSEEDILVQLEAISGLSPAERSELARQMMKIPRTDRVWFLDDLRRQMSERRMDPLTRRTDTPSEPEQQPEPVEPTEPIEEPSIPDEPPPPIEDEEPEPEPEVVEEQPEPEDEPETEPEVTESTEFVEPDEPEPIPEPVEPSVPVEPSEPITPLEPEVETPIEPAEPVTPLEPAEPVPTEPTPTTEPDTDVPLEPPEPIDIEEVEPLEPPIEPPEPEVPSLEVEIRQELDKIPGLQEEEKADLIERLKAMSKEERDAVYQSLRAAFGG